MFISQDFDFKAHKVTYIGPPCEDWDNAKEYEVLFQKLKDGRMAVFKSSAHFSEAPGYRLYESQQQLNQNFKEL
jgi:hypothetical protein